MTNAPTLNEAELRGMAFVLGVHPDNVEAIFHDLAKTQALVEEALALGVKFKFGLKLLIAFPKTMATPTKKRLLAAITAKSMAVAWVLDARANGVESAFASMFAEPSDFVEEEF